MGVFARLFQVLTGRGTPTALSATEASPMQEGSPQAESPASPARVVVHAETVPAHMAAQLQQELADLRQQLADPALDAQARMLLEKQIQQRQHIQQDIAQRTPDSPTE